MSRLPRSTLSLQRRAFLLGASASVGTAVLPRGVRARESAGPVLLIGGSAFVGALGRLIEEGLGEQGLTTERHAKSSTGLARPDFHDWPHQARSLYESSHPVATVCMFGGNDGQALHMGKGAAPQWIRWEDEGWAAEYRRRVERFAEAVAPAGEPLHWVGMPVMRASKLRSRMERMNEIFRSAMEARPGGHFIDTWSVLADDQGRYAETLVVGGKRVAVRTPDGVHTTLAGARVLAEHIVPKVAAGLG